MPDDQVKNVPPPGAVPAPQPNDDVSGAPGLDVVGKLAEGPSQQTREEHPVFARLADSIAHTVRYYTGSPVGKLLTMGPDIDKDPNFAEHLRAVNEKGVRRAEIENPYVPSPDPEAPWNKPFARFRQGLTNMSSDLHRYADRNKPHLTAGAYALLHGVAGALDFTPVGSSAAETAALLPLGGEGKVEGAAKEGVDKEIQESYREYMGPRLSDRIPELKQHPEIEQKLKDLGLEDLLRKAEHEQKVTAIKTKPHLDFSEIGGKEVKPTEPNLERSIPSKLYHITDASKIESIRKKGLKGSLDEILSGSAADNPGVNTVNSKSNETILPGMEENGSWVEIDTSKLDKSKFRNMGRGWIRYEGDIPAEALKFESKGKEVKPTEPNKDVVGVKPRVGPSGLPLKPATPDMPSEDLAELGLFSPVERMVTNRFPERMTADQALNTLRNAPGISPAELRFSGLDEFLQGKGGEPITKGEIVDFLKQNAVDLEETQLGRKQKLTVETKPSEETRTISGVGLPKFEKFNVSLPTIYDYDAKAPTHNEFGLKSFKLFDLPNNADGQEALKQLRTVVRGHNAKIMIKGRGAPRVSASTAAPVRDSPRMAVYLQNNESEATDWGGTRYKDLTRSQVKNVLDELSGESREIKAQDIIIKDEKGKVIATHKGSLIDPQELLRSAQASVAKPQYKQYVLPGPKENYRELLLRLPGKTEYTSPHFHAGGRNLVAHARVNDRTSVDGEHLLFVDEVQSDWANALREQGERRPRNLEVMTLDEANKHYPADVRGEYGSGQFEQNRNKYVIVDHDEQSLATHHFDTKAEAEHHLQAIRGGGSEQMKGVAPQPFKGNWHELVMKRLTRLAAEEGYDGIAWTTGEQQADRWNLAKVVDKLEYKDGTLRTYRKNSEYRGGMSLNQTLSVTPEELKNYVGKDIAKQLVEKGSVQGEGLKVGGDWARRLYDEMIPQFLDKLGKRVGGITIGETKVPTHGGTTPGFRPPINFEDIPSVRPGAQTDWMDLGAELEHKYGIDVDKLGQFDHREIDDAKDWIAKEGEKGNQVIEVETGDDSYVLASIKPIPGQGQSVHVAHLTPEATANVKERGLPVMGLDFSSVGGKKVQDAPKATTPEKPSQELHDLGPSGAKPMRGEPPESILPKNVEEVGKSLGISQYYRAKLWGSTGLSTTSNWYDLVKEYFKTKYPSNEELVEPHADEALRKALDGVRMNEAQRDYLFKRIKKGESLAFIDPEVKGRGTAVHETMHTLTEQELGPDFLAEFQGKSTGHEGTAKGRMAPNDIFQLIKDTSKAPEPEKAVNEYGFRMDVSKHATGPEYRDPAGMNVEWLSRRQEYFTELMTQYFIGNLNKGSKSERLAEAILRTSKNPKVQALLGTSLGAALLYNVQLQQQNPKEKK